MLEFLYTASCLVPPSLLVCMLETAEHWGTLELHDAAVAAIKERLSPDSCVGTWQLASKFKLELLEAAARAKCLRWLTELDDELLAASMLQDDELTAEIEEQVCATGMSHSRSHPRRL